MPNKVEQLADGNWVVDGELGEHFTGTAEQVLEGTIKSQQETKKTLQQTRTELAQAKAEAERIAKENEQLQAKYAANNPGSVLTPAEEKAQKIALGRYTLEAEMLAEGFDGTLDQYIAKRQQIAHAADDYVNRNVASAFLAENPDFPNNQESIESIDKLMRENNLAYTPKNLAMAHSYAIVNNLYKGLSPEEQRRAVSDQEAIAQNRGTPPPMVRSQNPESVNQTKTPEQMTTAEIKALYFQQLAQAK